LMAINQGLYGLLLQAIEDGRQQQADPVPVLSPALRDPNFRQLSRAPFVERLQSAEYPDVGAAASADRSGMGAGVPWTFDRSPMTPMPVGFRRTLARPGPVPPPTPTAPGYTPQRAISEGLKRWGLLSAFMLELERKRLMGELDDGDQDAAVGPILELYQRGRRGTKSKGGSGEEKPVTIVNPPSTVPEADADASASVNTDTWCDKRKKDEEARCKNFPKDQQRGCRDRATTRWDKCNQNYSKGRPWDEPDEWVDERLL
jgi:hypothetical protein